MHEFLNTWFSFFNIIFINFSYKYDAKQLKEGPSVFLTFLECFYPYEIFFLRKTKR
jgi:hypothetical protein